MSASSLCTSSFFSQKLQIKRPYFMFCISSLKFDFIVPPWFHFHHPSYLQYFPNSIPRVFFFDSNDFSNPIFRDIKQKAQLVRGVCEVTTKGLVGWVRVALHACLIRMAGTKRNNTLSCRGSPAPGADNTGVDPHIKLSDKVFIGRKWSKTP